MTTLNNGKEELTTDDVIFNIEDYVGGNIEGVEKIDRMGFCVFLRRQLEAYANTKVQAVLSEAEAELLKFTAKHDQPMRDEAIAIIQSLMKKGKS